MATEYLSAVPADAIPMARSYGIEVRRAPDLRGQDRQWAWAYVRADRSWSTPHATFDACELERQAARRTAEGS